MYVFDKEQQLLAEIILSASGDGFKAFCVRVYAVRSYGTDT